MRYFSYRVYDKEEKQYSDAAFSIDQYGTVYIQDEDGYWEEIDEERYVVELCTGLEDKNGKMIHEGDILKSKIGKTYEVGFDDGHTRFESNDGSCGGLVQGYIDEFEMVIIGTIHENPELLGEK